jgi:hypothetical protein
MKKLIFAIELFFRFLCAIIFASIVMLWVILEHIVKQFKIKLK